MMIYSNRTKTENTDEDDGFPGHPAQRLRRGSVAQITVVGRVERASRAQVRQLHRESVTDQTVACRHVSVHQTNEFHVPQSGRDLCRQVQHAAVTANNPSHSHDHTFNLSINQSRIFEAALVIQTIARSTRKRLVGVQSRK